eukprot:GDKI01001987.1.p1 GENE.GDKI01001987.1~~GDKI01001987.1.p1  ORF type:complete len:413 (+),score=94.99 GDKI01001987.1:94-1332(+)
MRCSRAVLSAGKFLPRDVCIVSVARTPIGAFQGSLQSQSAAKLGATAISNAVKRAKIDPSDVEGVVMGHVLSGGCGQAPARQAAIGAKIPTSVDVYAVNKVCASGLKSVALAAQTIALGHADIMVAGGMESMSQAPFMLSKARQGGYKYGHGQLEDAIITDGLWDPYNDIHMGKCAEKTARDYALSRVEQDNYAVSSYKRAADAWKSGAMGREVCGVRLPVDKRASPSDPDHIVVEEDEQYKKLKLDKVAGLKPAFEKDGTITAANASALNDGAAAVVLMSHDKAKSLGLQPLARVLSFADAAIEPIDFPIAPATAVKRALKSAGLSKVDVHEINEAFATVVLANMKLLNVDHSNVNLHGGAISLGHPLGASGTRILCTLLSVMQSHDMTTGCASICNGGGGASAMIIERMC